LGSVATDTLTTNLPIFTVNSSVAPTVNLSQQTWYLEAIDVLITQEFSDFLMAAGASTPVAGLKIAEARADRRFIPLNATTTPEPASILAILLIAGAGLISTKRP
jgi:hypothetical protein